MAQIEINEATIRQAILDISKLRTGLKIKYPYFDFSLSLGEKSIDTCFKDDIHLKQLTDDDWAGLFRGDYYLFWDMYDYDTDDLVAWGNIIFDTERSQWVVIDNDFRK